MGETTQQGQDSALRELAEDASSRKRFLKMMGGAGAAGAFAIFLAACGDDDDGNGSSSSTMNESTGGGKPSAGDLAIVQYALTLEHLETDFYNAVLDSGVVKNKQLGETAKLIRDAEQAHVDTLTGVVKDLGGKPMRPKTTFDAVLEGGEMKVLETAAAVENLGAAAYLGQAARIKSKEILAAALSIHSVEARHAAALNRVVGKSIVPDGAFAKPASMARGPAASQAVPRLSRRGREKEKYTMSRETLAAPELAAIDIKGMTRQSFMVRGAVTAGAVYGLGAVGPFVKQAIAQEGGGDVDILNFALTLEYLEAAFYDQGLMQVSGLGGEAKSLATEIRDNENEHVTALIGNDQAARGQAGPGPGAWTSGARSRTRRASSRSLRPSRTPG